MTTKELTRAQATKKWKSLSDSIAVFEFALGQLEVNGWFGGAPTTTPLAVCDAHDGYGTKICVDGGPICAGIAIHQAAGFFAKARRWNADRTAAYQARHLDLLTSINEIDSRSGRTLRGVAQWNDRYGVTYEEVKAAFAKVLATLGDERFALVQEYGLPANTF